MTCTLFNWHLSPSNPVSFEIQAHQGPYRFAMLDLHQSMHLNMLLEGELECTIRNLKYHFSAGDFNLISPWEIHGNTVSEAGFCLSSLTIHPEQLKNSLLTGQDILMNFLMMDFADRQSYMQLPETVSICRQLHEKLQYEENRQGSYRKNRQWLAAQIFFVELLDILEKRNFHAPSDRSRIYRKLQPALNRLYSESGNITLTEAAAACYLSVDYFSHLFKSCFGRSFAAFELSHRLNLAAADLRQNNRTLKEIAAKYHFSDKSHFSRCFRDAYGLSPGSFRKQLC